MLWQAFIMIYACFAHYSLADSQAHVTLPRKRPFTWSLLLCQSSDLLVTICTDADRAGCPNSQRSSIGCAISGGSNTISWYSKKQSTHFSQFYGSGISRISLCCSWNTFDFDTSLATSDFIHRALLSPSVTLWLATQSGSIATSTLQWVIILVVNKLFDGLLVGYVCTTSLLLLYA